MPCFQSIVKELDARQMGSLALPHQPDARTRLAGFLGLQPSELTNYQIRPSRIPLSGIEE